MSDRAEQCRQKALQWEHQATVATGLTKQETYAELARQWRDLADYFEEVKRSLAD